MSISRSEYRFLLGLARQLLAEQPSIKTSELARQLGISIRAAYNYRVTVRSGAADPPDTVARVRQYLLKHPQASGREVGLQLGLGRHSGQRYIRQARADLEKNPPAPEVPAPKNTYHVPRFLPKKGK